MTTPHVYSPVIDELLREPRLMPLGRGQPNAKARGQLVVLNVPEAFQGRQIHDADMAQACLAGLWLYHDFLDEAHALSQEIATPTGSFWHGIMHRREGDFGNAQYWFRRVGTHPVFGPLYDEMQELATNQSVEAGPGREFILKETWDPFAFVDLVEAVAQKRSRSEAFCRQVQLAEWRLLFSYCFGHAVGDTPWR